MFSHGEFGSTFKTFFPCYATGFQFNTVFPIRGVSAKFLLQSFLEFLAHEVLHVSCLWRQPLFTCGFGYREGLVVVAAETLRTTFRCVNGRDWSFWDV